MINSTEMEIERRRNQINELKNHYDQNYKLFLECITQKRKSLKGSFSSNNDQVYFEYRKYDEISFLFIAF